MRSRVNAVLISAALGLALSAGAGSAVTIDPASTMMDSVLSNRRADGPVNLLSGSPYLWSATFQNSDRGGGAVFKFRNDTDSKQAVTVALEALLDGLRGKFRHGITAKWMGTGELIRLRAGLLDTVSMSKVFEIGQTSRLRIRFGNPVANKHSFPGLTIRVSSQDVPATPGAGNGTPSPSPAIPPISDDDLDQDTPLPIIPPVTDIQQPSVPAPSPVPLPAGWMLMLSALAGGGLFASRKRAAHHA